MTDSAESRPRSSPIEDLSNELAQLVDQQAATSEVLLAVGRSDFELQPIFETVLEHAMRLCRAEAGQIFVHEGDHSPARVRLGRLRRVPIRDRRA